MYNLKTRQQVRALKPEHEVSGESFWLDISYGIRVFKCSNDEYLVFVKEDRKAKVAMYRLRE